MARVFKFGAAALTVLCSQAWALGLGEIETQSALNEKFRADIEVLDSRGLQPTEIIVSLASGEDFKRVGVERFFYLTDLRFTVESRAGQDAIVRVTSAQPITEPYLNFLVEVLWPNGRLLKEYTVLLDPPTFTNQPGAQVSAAETAAPSAGVGRVERDQPRPESRVRIAPSSAAAQPVNPRATAEPRVQGDEYGLTNRQDTLWSIAARTKSDSVSINQSMLALQRLNSDAFIGGNINLMKAGHVLRLPTEEQALSVSVGEANAQVAAQNDAWRRGTPVDSVASTSPAGEPELRGQVDATSRSTTRTASASREDGELRIVAGDTGVTAGASGAGGAPGAVGELENQLAASEEERDRVSRENTELLSRLDQVVTAMEQTQRQIEVRDQQIAQLQQRLADMEAAQAAAARQPPPQARIDEPRPQDPSQQQNQSSTPATPASSMFTSPMFLGGGALVLLLVLALAWYTNRRRGEAAQGSDFESDLAFDDEEATVVQPLVSETSFESDDDDDLPLDSDDFAAEEEEAYSAEEEDAEIAAGGQTSDVIGEADIYIAYGRFPQAVALLEGALNQDADRHDVRLKLLELFAETRDNDNFDAQFAVLAERCDDGDLLLTARELQAKLNDGDAAADSSTADIVEPSAVDETSELDDVSGPDLNEDFELELDAAADDDDRTRIASQFATESATEEYADAADATLGATPAWDADEAAEPDAGFDAGLESGDESSDDMMIGTPGTIERAVSTDQTDFELDNLTVETTDERELEVDDFELELEPEEAEPTIASSDELGGDLGIDFDPDVDSATDDEDSTVIRESSADTADSMADGASVEFESVAEDSVEPAIAEPASEEPADPDLDDLELDAVLESLDLEDDANADQGASSLAGDAPKADGEFSLDDLDLDDLDTAVVDDISEATDTTSPQATPQSSFGTETAETAVAEAPVAADEDEFDFASGDTAATKLDLARAYIDMGDNDGARDILSEVVNEGSAEQQQDAKTLLEQID